MSLLGNDRQSKLNQSVHVRQLNPKKRPPRAQRKGEMDGLVANGLFQMQHVRDIMNHVVCHVSRVASCAVSCVVSRVTSHVKCHVSRRDNHMKCKTVTPANAHFISQHTHIQTNTNAHEHANKRTHTHKKSTRADTRTHAHKSTTRNQEHDEHTSHTCTAHASENTNDMTAPCHAHCPQLFWICLETGASWIRVEAKTESRYQY